MGIQGTLQLTKVVSINIDTFDYLHTGLSNEIALNHQQVDATIAASNAQSMSFISLDHDFTTGIVQWTAEYVADVKAKGYKFVTVAECLGDSQMYRD
jgi:hypothetical protein